jgi:hypothetical protein
MTSNWRIGRTAVAVCGALFCMLAAPPAVIESQEPQVEQNEPEKLIPEESAEVLKYLSSIPSQVMAKSLGPEFEEIDGIPLTAEAKQRQRALLLGSLDRLDVPSIAPNVPIGNSPNKHENEPTVVVNPQNDQILVAGSHFFGPPPPPTLGVRCVAFRSADGGQTWSGPVEMPQLTPVSTCSDPVLAYAPEPLQGRDHARVYYAYMDIKPPAAGGTDIVVSFSDNNGETWVGPILVLDGVSQGPVQFIYDKPWIGTHVAVPEPQPQNVSMVYVTATLFGIGPPSPLRPPTTGSIAFIRSTNQAVSWFGGVILESGVEPAPGRPQVVVQGSRPTGGLSTTTASGEVLVAWYRSGDDGWLEGEFNIRVARSGNHGVTFDPPVSAVTDIFEAPFFLGPNSGWHRWWLVMFPDVEIGPDGAAHIVYAHDPVPQPAPGAINPSSEDGDIRYLTSLGPPYGVWVGPVTLSDDTTGQAQGFAAVETGLDSGGPFVQAIWQDHRLTPPRPVPPNVLFDIFYSREVGGVWQSNSRVTDISAVSDFDFQGDYIDLTAAGPVAFGIWTDRRDSLVPFDFEDDVWGARIESGTTILTWRSWIPNGRSANVHNRQRR